MLSAVDERLRELAREAAGGDVEARGRWLAERLRLRVTSRNDLELAAWLGDAGARLALGAPPDAEDDFGRWLEGIAVAAPEAALRGAGPAVELAFELAPTSDAATAQAVAEAVAWERCPCDAHAAPVGRALRRATDPLARAETGPRLARLLLELTAVRAQLVPRRYEDGTSIVLLAVQHAASTVGQDVARRRLRQQLRDALVPWVLGETAR